MRGEGGEGAKPGVASGRVWLCTHCNHPETGGRASFCLWLRVTWRCKLPCPLAA